MKRFLNKLFGARKNGKPRRKPTPRLGVEALEDRSLMAASLTANLSGGILRIEGTESADTLVVRYRTDGYYTVDGVAGSFYGLKVARIDIDGLGGNDDIRVGTDVTGYQPITCATELFGGAGNDTIVGGYGADAAFGEAGNDRIWGRYGSDFIDGGIGDDYLVGNEDHDEIHGDMGNDSIWGSAGNDTMVGGPGTDTLTDSTGTNKAASGLGWFDTHIQDTDLRSLSRYLESDGSLSRDDMLRAFDQVGERGGVSSTEFGDLQDLVGSGTTLGMPDYVRVLSNKLVNGDPANAFYTGALTGAERPEALGNLAAGSSADHLDKLVGKWFKGEDRPLAMRNADDAYGYARASGSLFRNGLSATDVDQGSLGSCYLLGALASVAEQSPEAIEDMFIDNGDGTWTVRFYNNGVADYVTVDKYLPVDADGQFVYAGDGRLASDFTNELWVPLAEKAYAQLNASGWIGQDGTNSYAGMGANVNLGGISGGNGRIALSQITARTVTSTTVTSGMSTLSAQVIRDGLAAGDAYIAGGTGHLYAIMDVFQEDGVWKVRLYNPWSVDGTHDADMDYENDGTSDGLITVTWATFTESLGYFAKVA